MSLTCPRRLAEPPHSQHISCLQVRIAVGRGKIPETQRIGALVQTIGACGNVIGAALRWAAVASRSDAGSWKSRFEACRRRLSEAVEETKEARRAARDVPSLQAEVARLETLLSEAGIGSNESSTTEALRKENARLRKALVAPEAREGAIGPRPAETRRRLTALERSPDQKDTIRTLRKEITRLNNEVVRRDKQILQLNKRLDREKESTESIREAARKLSSESLRLHREVRILGDSEARARSLSDEVFWLRHALEVFKAGQEKLKARLVKLRAAGATMSKLPSDEAAQLRAALRRSRRQKTTIEALRKDNARLRRTMRKLETRKAALEVQPAKLRAIRKALESELAGLRTVRNAPFAPSLQDELQQPQNLIVVHPGRHFPKQDIVPNRVEI